MIAGAVIDLDFELVEEGAIALPAPVDLDFVAGDSEFVNGLEGGEGGTRYSV